MRKLVSLALSAIILALVMPIAAVSLNEAAKYGGVRQMPVPVVGTGSMYPSLFWEKSEGGPDDSSKKVVEEYRTTPHMYHRFQGISIAGNIWLRRSIGYGDMVAFANSATRSILEKDGKDTSAGFIKRVIGVPGDSIELRDGFVYKNGQILDEPYIYKPRSTYGDATIADCRSLHVPPGKYVVMGDNRKTSSDSRGELGLIDESDITYILPYGEQSVYQGLYRDTTQDAELSGKPTLDTAEFVRLVNGERASNKIGQLKLNKSLVNSSTITGNKYLAGIQNYPLNSALEDAGYTNIVTGQFVTPGHYDAEELMQNLLFFPDTAKQILDARFQDIGIAAITKNVDGCPTQIIVGHLGGYIPAEYDSQTIQSWVSLQSNLESVIPSWEKARQDDSINTAELEELLTLLHKRLALAREIIDVMRNNKWLTADEQARIKIDDKDAERANQLVKALNGGE